ncbi:hypothetical protein B5X24_HaOG211722 [Helicoverpa armigera]|nr:hypothetical protein B5X24_HaOG211722 [Helicoverpa armigera]
MLSEEETNKICDTLRIARNITQRIYKTPAVSSKEPEELSKLVSLYTGVKQTIIDDILSKKKNKSSKPFSYWCKHNNMKNDNMTPRLSFLKMRRIIFNQYVNRLQVPTKRSIMEEVRNLNSNLYREGYQYLDEDLVNLGFMWKRLPKVNRYILLENTEQFYNRMKYLQQMKEYRAANRVIVHLERTLSYFFDSDRILVASPQVGMIDIYLPPKGLRMEHWLLNKLHLIPPKSVIVIETSNRAAMEIEQLNHCNLPNAHSHKDEMIQWLQANDIPCDSTMHRQELFALVQKYKVHCKPKYRFCEFLKTAGHDVVLRPPELAETKYFSDTLNDFYLQKHLQPSQSTLVAHMNLNEDFWLDADRKMAAIENNIYNEDQKLELVIEKLMENLGSGSVDNKDLEECEEDAFDSDYYGNFVYDASQGVQTYEVEATSVIEESVKPGPSTAP